MHKSHLRRLCLGVVALLCMALPGAVGWAATMATAATPNFSTDPQLNELASSVAADLQQQLAANPDFGYLQITNTGVEVALTNPAQTTKTLISATASKDSTNVPVTYTIVAHSWVQLADLTTQLTDDASTWAAKGVHLASFGPDNVTDTVQVRLNPYTDAAAELLEQAFGELVTVETGSTQGGPSSRTSDSAPWFGADEITTATTGCTSWFTTYDHVTSQHVMVTAGHCGTGVWKSPGSGATVGNVSSSAYVHFSGGHDAERSSTAETSVGNYVWADPHVTTRTVTASQAIASVGTHVCNDGYSDRENCNVVINSTGQSDCYDSQCISGLEGAGSTSGNAFTPGDSGGPVYSVPANLSTNEAAVTAYGMIVAWQDSYRSGYIEPTSEVLSAFGTDLAVVT